MADTGTWVEDRKCFFGKITIKYFEDVGEGVARQKCAQHCVNWGQKCHYANLYMRSNDGICYLYDRYCGDNYYKNDLYGWDVWVRNELHPDPARTCPGQRFPENDDAKECWESDDYWCSNDNFPISEWGRWICKNCASCAHRGGSFWERESAIGDIKPVESATCDIDDKEPHKCARNINTFQKEQVIGFLSLTRSMWMGILAIVGLLAIVRSIYSICTRKAVDTYEEV